MKESLLRRLSRHTLKEKEKRFMENEVSENLQEIILAYGFLLKHPGRKETFNNLQFAEAIKKAYSLEDIKNKYFYNFCLTNSFTIEI